MYLLNVRSPFGLAKPQPVVHIFLITRDVIRSLLPQLRHLGMTMIAS